MTRKILLLLAILGIILVSGCVQQKQDKTSVVYSPDEVWNNRVSLENKVVTVEGIIQTSVDCTKGPSPNTCDGIFKFQLAYPNSLDILGTYNDKRVGCDGTDINLNCYPFKEGKKYRLNAMLKKKSNPLGDYYFLELQDFTAVDLPEDSCLNIKDAMECVKNEHCQPMMGPSACSPDGRTCTADETFKKCVSKE